MPSQIYAEKLEWTSNANRLKFNGRLAQIHFNLIGPAIVAFLRRKLSNFRKTRKITTRSNTQDTTPAKQLAYGLQPIRFNVRTHVRDPALATFWEGCQGV